ncbi:hypothetical protein BD779DRAFT_1610673 [Infundibulicybe gibba]|nr:hypothetical protein BD779DRAFT_1610673 [Infundibulicybe gibba]
MSTETTTNQTQTRPARGGGRRGRGAPKGRGNTTSGWSRGPPVANNPKPASAVPEVGMPQISELQIAAPAENEDEPVCWICAEPVKYYSISECNHRTCHVCALRLRALYKKTDCTFCKDPQSTVIFTVSPDALIPYKDAKLSIYFETQEMMEETLILLRFNCPDPECEYIATHGKLMCDLCIRHKKVFAHEHAIYPPNLLPLHLPSMHHRQGHNKPTTKEIEGGIHPLCEFCRECFFSSDELFSHMRERHEECFICKRNEVRDQYFQNYDALEKHFNNRHHPCTQSQCLARKRGRRDRGDRERDREPPPQPAQGPNIPARPPGAGRRREGFGSALTVEGSANPSPNANTPENSRRPTPSPPRGDVDPAVAERHAMFMSRLQALAGNSANAVPAVKAAIRGYRASEISARDLISTIWNTLERNLEHTASIINAFVDLLEEEEKKQDLLGSWRGFAVEQRRQFPDLVPTAVGSEYAGIAAGRVLNAKHATATRSSQRSSRQVWDRVAQAAGSSSSLVNATPAHDPPIVSPLFTQPRLPQLPPQRSGNHHAVRPGQPPEPQGSALPPKPRRRHPSSDHSPPKLSNALFPELPTSNSARTKAPVSGNVSLRNIIGTTAPPAVAWTSGPSAPTLQPSSTPPAEEGDETTSGVTTGRKKGKGKQKQTLFTLGTFPT